ncbi:hypothetical protein [Pontibacter ummariensis]|nr:hypothetical protein [Pontibacter ummariensis]
MKKTTKWAVKSLALENINERIMAKSQNARKEEKKKPAKTTKEKRAEKQEKQQEKKKDRSV